MPLDLQAQAVADALAGLPAPDPATMTIEAYRAFVGAFPPLPGDPIAGVEERSIPVPGGALRVRLYRPQHGTRLPLTVFFHGGGFVSGSLATHDNLCSRLAREAATVVASVDYRLAPEHRFPAAANDAIAAIRGLHQQASALDVDGTRIAVAGDSAGGNLAAVAAQQCALVDGPRICHQLLLYPVLDSGCATPSFSAHAQGALLSAALMRWFWRQYLPNETAGADPMASPARQACLQGLPAATIISAECDPLRDEAEAYAAALAKAGVPVDLRRWPGQFHGFASLLGQLEQADKAVAHAAQCLRRAFDAETELEATL